MALAVFCIYAVDFAINGGRPPPSVYSPASLILTDIVQATCRSLIVDTLPESQQQLGSAWGQYYPLFTLKLSLKSPKAGRMLGLGHVIGYLVGTIDLSTYLGTSLGATQFKQICVIAGATIVLCVSLTCFCVEERVLITQRRAD